MALADDDQSQLRKILSEELTEVLIRVALIGFMVVLCARIFAPFASIMLWALILAVSLYPLCKVAASHFGGRHTLSAVLLVISGLILIGVPTVMLGSQFASQTQAAYAAFQSGSVTIPLPDPAIAQWPLVGERLFSTWKEAATNLPGLIESLQPQLGNLTRKLLQIAAGTMGEILVFLGALILAGIMMAFGESGSAVTVRILNRLVGTQNGSRVYRLITSTMRSVATGVIGVAFIQSLLLGIGFALAGIPVAGVLALVVLVVGILQLPALIVSIPVIGYLWWMGDGSATMNVVWTVYLLVAGMADNVLKPLLLGRGVDAPMPIVLIGALGGMMSAGMVGLFLGAVLLAVGYVLFMDWAGEARSAKDAGAQKAAIGD